MDKEFEKIILGGVETEIRSFESAMKICNSHRKSLRTGDYISALYNNLGFTLRPKNFDFIDKPIPIEEVKFEEFICFKPILPGVFLSNYTSLDNLLNTILFWCKGKVHSGLLLNPGNTYKEAVTERELEWAKENNFDVKRPAIVTEKTEQWLGADIRTSRLYNLNPNINEEYFNKHVRDFDKMSLRVNIKEVFPLFMMAVIEPDSIMSLLRRVEMEAIDNILWDKCDGFMMNIDSSTVVEEYERILYKYTLKISSLLKEKGTKAVAELARSVNHTKNISKDLANNLYSGYVPPKTAEEVNRYKEENGFIDTFSMLETAKEKREYIERMDLNNTERNIGAIVSKHVDVSNLSKMLRKYTQIDPNIYIDTMKNLYILISQINLYIPQYITGITEKLVISKNLFLDKNNFGLFNKNFDNFVFIDSDYNIIMCDIDKIGGFIKDKYGKDVRLVPKEDMGNKKLEREIPDLEFKMDILNKQEKIDNNHTEELNIETEEQEEESYGFNIKELVENG